MIRVIDVNGRSHYLAPQTIAHITEAGTSSQWHGIRAYVRTSDGQTIEATETADQIAALLTNVLRAARDRGRELADIARGEG